MKKMQLSAMWAKMAAAMLTVLTLGAAVAGTGTVALANEVTTMSAQSAKVKGDSVNTRSGAGTNYDKVEALSGGTEVTVTGQAADSEGKVWYQVTLPSGKTAFIRNDFLELGEVLAPTEPEPSEEPSVIVNTEIEPSEPSSSEPTVSAPVISSQYVALYEEDDQGTYYWYLHNNDDGYRVKIDDLLAAARSVDEIDAIEKQNKTLKTVLIVAGIVTVVLIIIMVVLILRLRDYMLYEDDEEEEEEEPRRSSASFVKRRRDEDLIDEETPPARPQRSSVRPASGRADRDYDDVKAARNSRQERASSRESAPQRPRESEQQRRARNITRDDDDLEYEFLNMGDDK